MRFTFYPYPGSRNGSAVLQETPASVAARLSGVHARGVAGSSTYPVLSLDPEAAQGLR